MSCIDTTPPTSSDVYFLIEAGLFATLENLPWKDGTVRVTLHQIVFELLRKPTNTLAPQK